MYIVSCGLSLSPPARVGNGVTNLSCGLSLSPPARVGNRVTNLNL